MIKKVYREDGKEISLATLISTVNAQRTAFRVAMSSGFFAPLHSGHVDYLRESSRYGLAHIVVINDDEALKAKKGFVAVDEEERARLLLALRYVDYVIIWSGTGVADCIRQVRPQYFTNGGDRSTMEVQCPNEVAACEEVGCTLILGAGGTKKIQSSSKIIQNILTNAPGSDIIKSRN